MLLARAVERPRWLRRTPAGATGPCADALTRDLQTKSDRLSWWVVDDAKEEVAIAIASSRHHISNVDLAIVSSEEFDKLDISWDRSSGDTPYVAANERHCDLINLSATAIARLANHLHSQREAIERVREGEVREMLIAAIGRGNINLERVRDSLLSSLATRLCSMDDSDPSALTAVLEEVRSRVEAGDLNAQALHEKVNERIAELAPAD